MTAPTLYSVARFLFGVIAAWSPTVPEAGQVEWSADDITMLRRLAQPYGAAAEHDVDRAVEALQILARLRRGRMDVFRIAMDRKEEWQDAWTVGTQSLQKLIAIGEDQKR